MLIFDETVYLVENIYHMNDEMPDILFQEIVQHYDIMKRMLISNVGDVIDIMIENRLCSTQVLIKNIENEQQMNCWIYTRNINMTLNNIEQIFIKKYMNDINTVNSEEEIEKTPHQL